MFFGGLFKSKKGVKAMDPLTRRARDMVRQELMAAARRHVAQERAELDDHNRIDLYFGGLDQLPVLTPKGLRIRFWRAALKRVPLEKRVEAMREKLVAKGKKALDLAFMERKKEDHLAKKAERRAALQRKPEE